MMMARKLMKYSQKTMLADRMSAYRAFFTDEKLEESLQFEKDNASHLVYEEGVDGAKKFVQGVGRHGKFNLLNSHDACFSEIDKDVL